MRFGDFSAPNLQPAQWFRQERSTCRSATTSKVVVKGTLSIVIIVERSLRLVASYIEVPEVIIALVNPVGIHLSVCPCNAIPEHEMTQSLRIPIRE